MNLILLALGALIYGACGVFFAELFIGIDSNWGEGMYLLVFFLWPIACVVMFIWLLIKYFAITYPIKLARWIKAQFREAFKSHEE